MEQYNENKPEMESKPFEYKWMRFPHFILFLILYVVINNPAIFPQHLDLMYLPIFLFIAISQGIFFTVYFSKPKTPILLRFISPIIWMIIFIFSYASTEDLKYLDYASFIFSFWGLLGIGLWLLFIRNTKLGFRPSFANVIGALAFGIIGSFNDSPIFGGIIYALISGAPFIFQIINSREKAHIAPS